MLASASMTHRLMKVSLTRRTNHGRAAVEADALSGQELRLIGKKKPRELRCVPSGTFALRERGRGAQRTTLGREIPVDVGREYRPQNNAVGADTLRAMVDGKR